MEALEKKKGESSKTIRERVERARAIQCERYKMEKYTFNSQIPLSHIEKYCFLGKEEKELINNAYDTLGLSVRAYYKLIRVARTIADLEGVDCIRKKHLSEAIGYRTELV